MSPGIFLITKSAGCGCGGLTAPAMHLLISRKVTHMTILQRIETLERSNRRWRMMSVVLGGILGAMLFGGAENANRSAEFDTLTCKTLTLVNNDGDRVGYLGKTDAGYGLMLKDPNTAKCISAISEEHMAGLGITGEDNKCIAIVAANDGLTVGAGDSKTDKYSYRINVNDEGARQSMYAGTVPVTRTTATAKGGAFFLNDARANTGWFIDPNTSGRVIGDAVKATTLP